jgi:hypothetical protein
MRFGTTWDHGSMKWRKIGISGKSPPEPARTGLPRPSRIPPYYPNGKFGGTSKGPLSVQASQRSPCREFNKWFEYEALAKVTYSVIPAKAGIQNRLKILDSGSRFACPE